jgi:regulator of sigma E protease
MNAVLTITLLTGFYMFGLPASDEPSVVGTVEAGSPAAEAGLLPGDEIVAVDGAATRTWDEAFYQVAVRPDRSFPVRVRREGVERQLEVRSRAVSRENMGWIGIHPLVRVGQVVAGHPAEAAGLKPDDAILAIADTPVRSFAEIPDILKPAAGTPLAFRIWRAGEILTLTVTPVDSGAGGRVGIGPRMMKLGFGSAFVEACRWSWGMTRQTFDIVKRLVTREISSRAMMGPLGIAEAAGDAARAGTGTFLFLVALISLQVGILNLFPLAPLDGGHLAILAVEGVSRRDLNATVKGWIMNAGAAAIFLLIGLVVYSDIAKKFEKPPAPVTSPSASSPSPGGSPGRD